jgi:hypothetical protein
MPRQARWLALPRCRPKVVADGEVALGLRRRTEERRRLLEARGGLHARWRRGGRPRRFRGDAAARTNANVATGCTAMAPRMDWRWARSPAPNGRWVTPAVRPPRTPRVACRHHMPSSGRDWPTRPTNRVSADSRCACPPRRGTCRTRLHTPRKDVQGPASFRMERDDSRMGNLMGWGASERPPHEWHR